MKNAAGGGEREIASIRFCVGMSVRAGVLGFKKYNPQHKLLVTPQKNTNQLGFTACVCVWGGGGGEGGATEGTRTELKRCKSQVGPL